MRRTKEEAEKTRIAILEAAEHLFLENGVAHTSLEQIARAAGVTRGAVYWHFQNKAHLFNEMLSQVRLPQEQMTELFCGCNGQEPIRALRDLCVEAIVSLARDEQRQRIFTILLHRCEFTEELREAEERHYAFVDQFIELSQALFDRPACRERLRPGITPLLASRAVHGMLVGLFSDWTRSPKLFDPLSDSGPMVDAVFRGLVKDWD